MQGWLGGRGMQGWLGADNGWVRMEAGQDAPPAAEFTTCASGTTVQRHVRAVVSSATPEAARADLLAHALPPVLQGLRREQIKRIVLLQAKRVEKRLADKKMKMELHDSGGCLAGLPAPRGFGRALKSMQPAVQGCGLACQHRALHGPAARQAARRQLQPCR